MRCGSVLQSAVDTPDSVWQQAQISFSLGGLGVNRVSYHSPTPQLSFQAYLLRFVSTYNNLVDPPDSFTPDSVDNSYFPLTQTFLSNSIC